MKKNIITSFLIVALSHYFLGCGSYKATIETDLQKVKIEKSKVLSVLLKTGIKITFKDKGGELFLIRHGIKGTTVDGNSLCLSMEVIKEMFPTGGDSSVAFQELLKNTSLRISRLILNNGSVVFYDQAGGKCVKELNIIKGITIDEKYVEIAETDVQNMEVMELNKATSVFSTLLVVAGIIAIIAL